LIDHVALGIAGVQSVVSYTLESQCGYGVVYYSKMAAIACGIHLVESRVHVGSHGVDTVYSVRGNHGGKDFCLERGFGG
jgi:hypothetical protein